MARNEEMVGSEASIPIRILVLNDVGDANREEEGVSLVGVTSREWAHPSFHFVHELSFDAVYVVHWTYVY
ncbi:hypothetical protein F2Q69_00000856 [Brassica cretica]|uniref:Uncharacterized protein n=1 Tax=Brassica cretica TaxID=69181 RepID=A0A8S9PG39_BRACR|nr:hypothetical protein F2Q69_00000856 [Brassica cretica]